MSKPLNPGVLRAHADFIEQKLEIREGETWTREQRWQLGEQIVQELVREHDAKFRHSSDTFVLRLAGLQSTCTAGSLHLLHNWVNAARRKITQLEAA